MPLDKLSAGLQVSFPTHRDATGQAFCRVTSQFPYTQGCHWTFAKITENLRVRAVSQKMNTKRDKGQKEKDEIGERIGPKITEKKKPMENRHP